MPDSVIETSYVYEIPKSEKIKNLLHNFIKFLGNLFFILLVALILIILVYNFYAKRHGISSRSLFVNAYVIVTPSMVPTINVSDAVVTYKPNVKKLKKGDIITFSSTDVRYTGLTVTHRILKVNNREGNLSFKTKGDNNTTPDDAEVVSSNVFGKVIFVIPWLGYLQAFLTKSYGWLLLVVLPCVAIIIYDVIKLFKTVKRSRVTKDIPFNNVEILDDVDDSSSNYSPVSIEDDEKTSSSLGDNEHNNDNNIELL